MPPEPILCAAARWLELIPESGIDRVRSVLHTSPRFADITPTQYETGLAWLMSTDLLGKDGVVPANERVFERAVVEADWFTDADMLVRELTELPEDALQIAAGLGLPDRQAFQSVRHAWGLFDDAQRKIVGAAGERALVDLLRKTIVGEVDHVASRADGYGYDIAVFSPGMKVHIEVKSTTRRGRLVLHISRNEYETMRVDPNWCLTVLRLDKAHEIRAVAVVPSVVLREKAPIDNVIGGRWESARVSISDDELRPGIPALRRFVRDTEHAKHVLGER